MTSIANSSASTASDPPLFRLTRARVGFGAAALLFLAACVLGAQFSGARDLVMPGGSIIGGDYAAFFAAAHAAADGAAAVVYDPASFERLLQAHGPPIDRYGLTWQYPPTYFLVVLPLAGIGYASGYAAWTCATATAFVATLRGAGFRGVYLIATLAAPAAFHALVTGQNGFLTAALASLAAVHARERPILAGLAAAALTVKPQLGLLLPVAYIAGGCWRAFAVAGFGAIALCLASLLAFGADAWRAFLFAAAGATEGVVAGTLPLYKMTTPLSAALLAGASPAVAVAFHATIASAAAAFVAIVWRGVRDLELRAAALLAGIFLAAPYGFYYELIILAAPAAIVARRAERLGWLKGEKAMLLIAFFLPFLLPGEASRSGVSVGFAASALVAGLVARRVVHEAPEAFRFATAAFRPRPG